MNERIGFIGLGIMGGRMARNLAQKGFAVAVWNRTSSKADALRPFGVSVADTPAALAKSADVLCSCVSDPSALREVALGADGLIRGARAGQLCIDFSTISPRFARELEIAFAEKNVAFVDAPVTGSKSGAENATLVIMAGGSPEAMARAAPIFSAVGQKVVHCGPVGAGSQVKLAGNALLALMLEGLSEGMLLTQRAGVDPRKFLEVAQLAGYRSPYFEIKGRAMLNREFDTQFSIDLMFKDLSLFLESAAEHRVPALGAAAVAQSYQLARAQGKGERDIAAVITALEDLCGEKLK